MNAPAFNLTVIQHPQAAKLDALIVAAVEARREAERGDLFASHAGHALVNAMFDLTEVSGLYDLADDVAHVIGESGR
jgi:hypothetical protein